MKIGIYDPYLDTLGGGEKYMLSLASCLSSDNHVEIFWDNPDILEKAEQRFLISLRDIKCVKNIFSPATAFYKKLYETKKYDCIVYLSDGSIPFVLSKHLFIHFQFPVQGLRSNIWDELKMYNKTTIICNSAYTKRYIDKALKKNSIIIYPPVENIGEREKKENIILTIGRYNRLPGGSDFKKQTVLIDVFKTMVDKGLKQWSLILVVTYTDRDKTYVDEMEHSTLGYPIVIMRNISHEQLVNMYKRADIYWHAAGFGEDIKKFPERAEHFGISTVEAMTAGCIPIVINAGGQSEIITHKENGFLWGTKEELIKITEDVIKGKIEKKIIKKNAIVRAKDFSYSIFSRSIKEIVL